MGDISRCTIFGSTERVHVADNADVQDAYLNTMSGHIHVGAGSFFGHQVMILTGSHDYAPHKGGRATPVVPYEGKDIFIEEGVWVASRAIIQAANKGPRRIGKYSTICAGAVVTKDVPPWAMVGGNPAKIIKYLYPQEEFLDQHAEFNRGPEGG